MLDLLAQRHTEWVDMAIAVGCPKPYAEDVVQEVYIKLDKYQDNIQHKLVLKDNTINTFYMFVTIRNMVRTMLKEEGTYVNSIAPALTSPVTGSTSFNASVALPVTILGSTVAAAVGVTPAAVAVPAVVVPAVIPPVT